MEKIMDTSRFGCDCITTMSVSGDQIIMNSVRLQDTI